MQLQYNNQADIPSGDEASFIEYKDGDKQIWMHKDLAESKISGFRQRGQLTSLQNDFESFKSGITVKQQEQESAAKLAQEQALVKQMAELKDSGKTSELHKLEMQQSADKYKSLFDSNEKLQESFTGLQTSLVETSNKTLATEIASKYVPAEMVDSFSKLLMMSHIKNVEGKSVFTNASGDAVDNDIDRVMEVLNQDPNLKHFAKFPGSKGAYGGKGGSDGANGKTMSRGAFKQLSAHEKSTAIRSGIKIID
jgi:hypothetical protein